jgi:hypothetical protein
MQRRLSLCVRFISCSVIRPLPLTLEVNKSHVAERKRNLQGRNNVMALPALLYGQSTRSDANVSNLTKDVK